MQEYIGKDSINKLSEILDTHKPKTILLVTGKSSYEKSGAKSKLDKILKGYKIVHFNDFEPNPKLEHVEKGLKVFNENGCDFVIAVGGGSAIDVAKAINILSANQGDPNFNFDKMHDLLYEQGFTIYPGKIGEKRTFRVANMGDIDHTDVSKFLIALKGVKLKMDFK